MAIKTNVIKVRMGEFSRAANGRMLNELWDCLSFNVALVVV